MLRWRVAFKSCERGRLRYSVAVPYSSSTLSRLGGGGNDCSHVENVELEVDRHWKTMAWEKKMLTGLKTYKEKNGHVVVPQPFTVPSGDPSWPHEVWGYSLGKGVNTVRKKLQAGELSPEMMEELETMGFVQNVSQFKWDHIVLPSLRQFYQVYGHTDVPQRFVVPEDDAWPKLAWGRLLGENIRHMRFGALYAEQMTASKEELEMLKFCCNIPEREWTEKILPSLQMYRQEYGHCIVKEKFKVPNSHPWPKEAWGMSLGRIVIDIRHGNGYTDQVARDKASLEMIGFAWDRDTAVWNEGIIPCIQLFVKMFKHSKIPSTFVVPSEDPWPRAAWKMELGKTMYRIRSGSFFSFFGRDFDVLDALGVNLKLSRRAWENHVVPLVEIYATLYGDEEIPVDFVILSEAPWPEKMWGVHLGLIVVRNWHLQ